ncbi:MAG: bacterioferritin [Hyphomicrobiaceae bacterium]|nr:bacterioferritin [Hyphomicrobiaceae bacterium]
MKGPEISLKHLQRAITMELTTVNQYLLQAHKFSHWGIDRLADRMFEEVKEEGEHANQFIARMMFLEGDPNVRDLDTVTKPETVRQIFETQHRMELEARAYYDKAARECQNAGDVGSFELFMTILKDEEGHIDFIEEQFDLMGLMGEQFYIGRQVSSVAAKSDEEDDS